MQIKVREAGQEDYHPLCQFIELVDNDFYPPLSRRGNGIGQRVRKCLDSRDSYFIIAEDSADEGDTKGTILGVIGCSKYWKSRIDAYINLMCVHPAYRKMGISKILYKELENRTIAEEIRKLYVCTWSTNVAAMQFYQTNGFRPYCIVKNDRGHKVDTIHYRKITV